MASSSASPKPDDLMGTSPELAQIWQQSLLDYEKLTGKVVKELPQPQNMDEIISFADREMKTFMGKRHPAGKLNAIRSYLGKNIDYIDTAAEFIADATTAVFPPTKAIYAVISYLLKTAKKLSAALDTIAKSFDEINTVLERINFLDEQRLPNIPGYKICIGRVFTSLMAIFGISTCYLKSGRAVKFFSKLVKGDDDELQGAYDIMIQAIQRLDPATNMATLRKVGDIEIRMINSQDEVRDRFDAADAQQQVIASNTEEILDALARFRKEVATRSAQTQPTQLSKDKDSGNPAKDGNLAKDGTSRKAVALNKIKKFFTNPTDPRIQFNDAEQFFVEHTMDWLADELSYEKWLEASDNPVLLISAGPGLGKTFSAYSLIRSLQASVEEKARTSVSYFFFKEEQSALASLKNALCAMTIQIAEKDSKYCEQAANELDYWFDPDLKDTVEEESISRIWTKFFMSKYPSLVSAEKASDSNAKTSHPADASTISETRDITQLATSTATKQAAEDPSEDASVQLLYIVLDGLDQMAEGDAVQLMSLLDQARSYSNIKFLLTSRPNVSFMDALSKREPLLIEITPEKANVDLKRLVHSRCDNLSRLRKFRPQTKKSISARLTFLSKQHGIGMLYADRALVYLDSIGREGAVLNTLRKLPHDLNTLYISILSDCSARRGAKEAAALKLFYASVAYSRRPLTLKESRALMSLDENGGDFHIEDEIRNRSSSILDLFRSLHQDGKSVKKSNVEEQDGSDVLPDTIEVDEDDNVPLNYQDRSLREFFRSEVDHSSQLGQLKLCSFHANLALFLASANAICGTPIENVRTTRVSLESYAANFWIQHFHDIEMTSADDTQVVQVVENLVRILTNTNKSSWVIQSNKAQCYSFFDLKGTSSKLLSPQDFIKWAERSLQLPKDMLSPAAQTWAAETIAKPSRIFSNLAKAHIRNWFWQKDYWNASNSFYYAWLALSKTDVVALSKAPSRTKYLKVDEILQIATAFGPVKTDGHPHRAIAWTLQEHEQYRAALEECKKDLEITNDPKNTFFTFLALAQIARSMAKADFDDSDSDSDSDDDDDDDDDDNSDSDSDPDDSEDEDEKPPPAEDFSPSELASYADVALDFARQALAVYPKEEVAAQSDWLRGCIQDAYITIAGVQRKQGKLDDAILTYEEARTINLRQGFLMQQITAVLEEQKKFSAVIERVEKWTPLERSYWLAMNEEDNWDVHELFQKAAKICEKDALALEVYEQLITSLDRDGNASMLRYQLAHFQAKVLGEPAKAIPLLNQLLDGEECKNLVTGLDDEDVLWEARHAIADLLYEQFRSSTDYTKKLALMKEFANLPNKQLASTYEGYEIADSPLILPLVRMTRKMGPACEYQKLMNSAFIICKDRLCDLDASNDGASFSTLAGILATVGGLQRDAEIAFSLVFSKTDPDISRRKRLGMQFQSAPDKNGVHILSEEGKFQIGPREATVGEDEKTNGQVETLPPSSKQPPQDPDKPHNKLLDGEELQDYYIECDGECEPFEEWTNWKRGAKSYMCLVCCDINLCEACHQKRLAENQGNKREHWRNYCGENHEYICGPIDGWQGVRKGVMKIGEEEIPFKEWLEGLQTRWDARWVEFWKD